MDGFGLALPQYEHRSLAEQNDARLLWRAPSALPWPLPWPSPEAARLCFTTRSASPTAVWVGKCSLTFIWAGMCESGQSGTVAFQPRTGSATVLLCDNGALSGGSAAAVWRRGAALGAGGWAPACLGPLASLGTLLGASATLRRPAGLRGTALLLQRPKCLGEKGRPNRLSNGSLSRRCGRTAAQLQQCHETCCEFS